MSPPSSGIYSGAIDRASPCLRTQATTSIGFIKPTQYIPRTERQHFPYLEFPHMRGLTSKYIQCFVANIVKSRILSN
jgi:hypothetical protein